MGYFHNLLLAFDQLANAICGGNSDCTISARVGYYAEATRNTTKWYWKTAEQVIDFTYWPMQGPNHCKDAFESDPENILSDYNSVFFLFLMSLIVIAICIPVIIILYPCWAIGRLFGFNKRRIVSEVG